MYYILQCFPRLKQRECMQFVFAAERSQRGGKTTEKIKPCVHFLHHYLVSIDQFFSKIIVSCSYNEVRNCRAGVRTPGTIGVIVTAVITAFIAFAARSARGTRSVW